MVGASAGSLLTLLARGYFLLLGIAAAIALPVSYLVGEQLLRTFAYHISLDIWIFLPGVVLLFLLGTLTIGSQILRAVRVNPVEALRNE